MNVYRITRCEGDRPSYAGDMAGAKAAAKVDSHRRLITDTRIDLVDVKTAKAELVALLNGYATNGHVVFPVLRTWRLTSRGGTREITRGE